MSEDEIGKEVVDAAVKVRVTFEPEILESVEQLSKIRHKQLFTYLKLKKLKPDFLPNFGTFRMKDGIQRMVNGLGNVPGNEMTTKAKRSNLWVLRDLKTNRAT